MNEFLALRGALLDEVLDLDIQLRVEHGEREVFQLPLDGLDAEAVRERRIDFERLLGLSSGGFSGHETPGSRIVQPVGQFDHEHPDVLGHRDDHLAHGLGLCAVAIFEFVELGDPIDEHRDLVAEVVSKQVERVVGVLDRVMEDRSGEGLRSDAEIREDLGDGDRMRDVRLSAAPQLPPVGEFGGHIGPLDHTDIGFRMVQACRLDQPVDRSGGLGLREDARKEGA